MDGNVHLGKRRKKRRNYNKYHYQLSLNIPLFLKIVAPKQG